MAKYPDARAVILVDENKNYAGPGSGTSSATANPNGQATSANSSPVVIASDQSTVPVSASTLPLPTGASTSALQGTGNTFLASIDGKVPAKGQTTAANSTPVVLASDQTAIPVATHAVTQSGTWNVTATPATLTAFTLSSAATTNATVAKASAGNLFEVTVSNPTATAAYLKVYNKATAPTVGTDVPIFILPVQGNSLASVSWDGGKRFAAGISYALTGAITVADTTASVAGVLISGSYI